MQNSMRVKIDGFGSFKIGINTKGAATPADFTVGKNVVGTHVVFQPEAHLDANRHRAKVFLQGVRVQETAKNAVAATGIPAEPVGESVDDVTGGSEAE